MGNRIEGDLIVTGHLTPTTMTVPASAVSNNSVAGDAGIARSKLAQDSNMEYPIPLTHWRVWNAVETVLAAPSTANIDDLGMVGGTFGTASPMLQTWDVKAAGARNFYARCLWQLPPEYDDAETVSLRVACAMITTVADATATIDAEVYESDKNGGIGSDLVTSSSTSFNSLTWANKDFTVSAAGLVSGDVLDIRLTMAINDAATGTEVKGAVGNTAILADIRG